MSGLWPAVLRLLRTSEAATLADLALVGLVVGLVFLARRAWILHRVRRAADGPALSVGGWGSRGKSGTERKKGALFHALEADVMVKTTGCEAELIHSHPGLAPREVFLYRPYDHATIWEQAEVAELAARAGSDVFCWESMALSPRYARILNEDWMRSPILTLTNTFPDHEDRQGPAGTDVARSLAAFTPHDGLLITTEEAMLPILADRCRRQGSRLLALGLEETALMPREVLERFPYQVHSANLALVVALGQELGVSPRFTLREVAEHLVPDLGALRVFPEARYRDRRLEFANAMSANERLGCLISVSRIGYDRAGAAVDPAERLVLLVNNRADRIARSRVFADILTHDLTRADAIVLVGTNLPGLEGYIRQALRRRLKGWDPYRSPGAEGTLEALEKELMDLGLPASDEEIRKRLEAIPDLPELPDGEPTIGWMDRLGLDPRGDLVLLVQGELERADRLRGLRRDLRQALSASPGARSAAAAAARSLLAELYMDKLVRIADPGASGNRILDELARLVPPGCMGRILGIQNIKGTGLDFVYRWVAFADFLPLRDRLLRAREPEEAVRALEACRSSPQPGLLEVECMLEMARHAAHRFPSDPAVLSSAELLQRRARQISEGLRGSELRGTLSGADWRGKLFRSLERLLDATDARLRRRNARRLYRDLADGVISHETASRLAHDLVERQKGGWLRRRLRRRWRG